MNYPIVQVLKKPDLFGRMVSWAVDLSEYDIQYIPKGSINPHVLTYFLAEFSTPTGENIFPAGTFLWMKPLTLKVVARG